MPSSTACRSCSSSKPSNPCPYGDWWDPGSPLSSFSPTCSIKPERRPACAPCKNASTARRLSPLPRATLSWHWPGYEVGNPYNEPHHGEWLDQDRSKNALGRKQQVSPNHDRADCGLCHRSSPTEPNLSDRVLDSCLRRHLSS